MKLRAPFPWFGGKSRAASLIWEGLGGDVPNYVEPFAGSLAVLLGRPAPARTETVNDLDAFVTNFWRALQADPEALAEAADWPVNEADLHARHRWLVANRAKLTKKLRRDPEAFDVRVAGWWVWGVSCWIGGGWCADAGHGRNKSPSTQARRPKLLKPTGIHRTQLRAEGRIPEVSASGSKDTIRRGVVAIAERRPMLGGSGVHAEARRASLVTEFRELAARLRGVRVVCGDWKRVLTPSVTTGHGLTAVVLDPPYAHDERADNIYACEGANLSAKVREWAIEHGDDPLLRIVLCGYEGEHNMPDTWRVAEWTAAGGYGRAEGAKNRHRERLWFSPACLASRQGGLFA